MSLYDIIDEVITGDWGEDNASVNTPCATSCIRSADIADYYSYVYDKIPVRYLSQKSFDERQLKEGDIIIEKSGGTNNCSTGRPIYVSKALLEVNPRLVCTNFCEAIRIKKDFNPIYVYYYIRLIHHSGVFHNFESKTSGIHNLQMEQAFKAVEMPVISYAQQSSVADFLSKIDMVLYDIKKQNLVLEAMAKQLYDYWFVQFDFPDESGHPYRSSGGKMIQNLQLKRDIPAGWEVVELSNILCKLESGKRPSGGIDKQLHTGIPSLGAECIDRLGSFNYSTTPYISETFKSKLKSGKIQNNDILLYKDGEYVGKTTLFRDDFPFKEAFVNEHVFLLRACDLDMEEYLFLTLNSKPFFNIMQSLGRAKAAQPGLNKMDVNNICIIKPNKSILKLFHSHIDKYFALLFSNSKEFAHLSKLKDFLLPLLMSGQLTLK